LRFRVLDGILNQFQTSDVTNSPFLHSGMDSDKKGIPSVSQAASAVDQSYTTFRPVDTADNRKTYDEAKKERCFKRQIDVSMQDQSLRNY